MWIRFIFFLFLTLGGAFLFQQAKPPPIVRTPAVADCSQGPLECGLLYLHDEALSMRSPKGYWPSSIDSGFYFEPMILAFGQKLNVLEPSIKNRFLQKTLRHLVSDKRGWPSIPRGPLNFEATGLILNCLKILGMDERNPQLTMAWQYFQSNGGIEKMSFGSRAFLQVIFADKDFGVSKLIPPISFLDMKGPFAKEKLGPVRHMLISLSVWKHLNSNPQKHDRVRIEKWLKWLLERQGRDGSWYLSIQTVINLEILRLAQEKNYGDFNTVILKGWKSILALEGKNAHGEIVLQPHSSAIWDSSFYLKGLLNYTPIQDKGILDQGIYWLSSVQIRFPSHWEEARMQKGAGWSFDENDQFMPDSDDTAAVLETIAAYTGQFPESRNRLQSIVDDGVAFMLNLQNKDGGFSSFNKDVQKLFFLISNSVINAGGLFADTSQIDVSARILASLASLKKVGYLQDRNIEKVFKQSCFFIYNNSSTIVKTQVEGQEYNTRLWKGTWFEGAIYGTTEALFGLMQGGCIIENKKQFFNQYVTWYLHQQNSDGGIKDEFSKIPNSTIYSSLASLKFLTEYVGYLQENFPTEVVPKDLLSGIDRIVSYLHAHLGEKKTPENSLYLAVYIPGVWYVNYEHLNSYGALAILSKWKLIKEKIKPPLRD